MGIRIFLNAFEDRCRAEGKKEQEMLTLMPVLLGPQARLIWSDIQLRVHNRNAAQRWLEMKAELIAGIDRLLPKQESIMHRVLQFNVKEGETCSDFVDRFQKQLAVWRLASLQLHGDNGGSLSSSVLAQCLL